MEKCESCGKEVEDSVKIKGQKLCVECSIKAQKDIDPDSLNFSACISFLPERDFIPWFSF